MTFATTEMYIHGHVGFPDTATERRTRIVNRKKRQRKRCDEKIGFAGGHNVRFDSAEQQGMHFKEVAVPVRIERRQIGAAG